MDSRFTRNQPNAPYPYSLLNRAKPNPQIPSSFLNQPQIPSSPFNQTPNPFFSLEPNPNSFHLLSQPQFARGAGSENERGGPSLEELSEELSQHLATKHEHRSGCPCSLTP
ncbi:unnamed protein product, partial [Vitis vinifera]|uniref:Uncharacterized protein n=1 Tax=Vitis vinifera TaxID=29760 RepID=D7TF59_VITVI